METLGNGMREIEGEERREEVGGRREESEGKGSIRKDEMRKKKWKREEK